MKIVTAAGAITESAAGACWSAIVLPVQQGEGATNCGAGGCGAGGCGAGGNCAGMLLAVGRCWHISVLCCCAQAAGLHLAADDSSDALRAVFGASEVLHTT